jgi:phosphate:Na+ symporter
VVLGASLGSGLTTFLMAGNLEGTPRQLGIFQVLFKAVGVAVLLPLIEAEAWTGRPMLQHQLEQLVADVPHRVAWVFLLCQIIPALLLLPIYSALERLLARLAPPSKAEELARPHYLFDQALMDAESALPLVEKEQARLLRLVPDMLDGVRAEPDSAAPVPAPVLHEAVTAVARAIDSFQTELLDGALPREELERGIRLKTRLEVLAALNDGVFELAGLIAGSPTEGRAHPLTGNVAESLHALLLTLAEAAEDPDPHGIDLLLAVAGDRGELMERVRAALMRADPGLPVAVQQALFAETTLFERLVWLIRRYALLLRGPDDAVDAPAALAAAAD